MRMRGQFTECQFPGCGRAVVAWGHCSTHAKQAKRGVPLTPILRLGGSPNRYEVDGETVRIFLTNARREETHVVTIDAADAGGVLARRWTHSRGYAMSADPRTGGTRTNTLLHRLLLSPEPGMDVDHINGDGLDNRRRNLRVVSHRENQQNVAYKGRENMRNIRVADDSPVRPFHARVMVGGREVSGGSWATIEEAREAAQRLRAEHLPFANEDRHALRE